MHAIEYWRFQPRSNASISQIFNSKPNGNIMFGPSTLPIDRLWLRGISPYSLMSSNSRYLGYFSR
jgi:hypothetical protein